MSCPTCDGTRQHVGFTGNGGAVHWCPRCGTVSQTFGTDERHDYVPKLVERCREFELVVMPKLNGVGIGDNSTVRTEWRRIGLAESINPPGKRPPWA